MDRDTTIIIGAVCRALASGLPEEGAILHVAETLNKIADEDGSRRGHYMRIIARGLTDGIQSVIKAV